MSSCCPPGSWPALESDTTHYKPQGQITDIGDGIEAYIVHGNKNTTDNDNGSGDNNDKNTNGCLVSFQDIFAYDSARHFQVVDQFAVSGGYTVVHVNFLGRDGWYRGDFSDFADWYRDHSYDAFIRPRLQRVVFPYITQTLGYEKVATIGFCYGSYVSFMAADDTEVASRYIVAGVGYHPSHKGHVNIDPSDPECNVPASRIAVPQLLVSANNDPDFVKPNGSLIVTLQSNHSPSSQAVVFDDMSHGWVNRGDVRDPIVKNGVKKAIQMAIDFLQKHMNG